MKIIKPRVLYQHSIGDILYGEELLGKVELKDLESLRYCYEFLSNEFDESILDAFIYECPFIEGNKHYWFFPSFKFTNLKEDTNYIHSDSFPNMANNFKNDQIRSIKNFNEYAEHNEFHGKSVCMGHGYTSGTLPYDGINGKDIACLYMDNGDILVGFTWVWFNK